ncbi:MAG: hypothetical protein HZA22_04225 [Nitrospirae bacterium]|nr:hypothetical protein [Nitrospirota bacterium]MBI5694943.1 hypothetical protein [Nitrospirota bacterium]
MERPISKAVAGAAALLVYCALALFISQSSAKLVLLAVGGLLLTASAFIYAEGALYALIFSMLLSPQIVVGETAAREITLRLDDFLIIFISLGWLARVAVNKELGLFLRTPLNGPIGLYILACVASTSAGVVAGLVGPLSGAFFLLKYVEFFFVYFIAVNHVKDGTQVKRFVAALLVVCLLTSIYALIQVPLGGRVSAPFEKYSEPNTLGGYLVLMLSLTAGMMMTARKRRSIFMLCGVGAVIAVPLLHTLSRASWLAGTMMTLALLVFSDRKLALAAAVALAVAVSPLVLPEQVKERAVSTFQPDRGFRQSQTVAGVTLDPSTSERISGFKRSLSKWSDRPIFGYGITGAGFIDGQYFRTIVELGLVGLAAFLYMLYRVFRILYTAYRSEEDPYFRGLALGALAGLLAMMAHALGSNSFMIVRIMEPFWFAVGLIVAHGLAKAGDSRDAAYE